MTDTNLGTAAGEIFAKAFTLGYETGREYVPVGGMALTAEQVEDVEALVATANPYSAPAARLRALFPATEPAEDAKPCGSNSVTLGWCKLAARHEGLHTNGTYLWGTASEPDPPAPAEPAEEVKPVHPRPDVGDWGYGGGAAVYVPEARGKTREELLSEKVEQLQDQVKHLSRVAVNAAEHGIKAPSGSLKPCGYCHSTEATLLHACTNCGAMTSDPWSHPTPAEPAEEETKAERDSQGIIRINGGRIVALSRDPRELVQQWYDLAEPGSKWQRDYAAALDLFDREATSSPVVPAPTETEWQTWQEVPEGVWFLTNQNIGCWMRRDGDKVTTVTGGWPVCTDSLVAQAPFIAAAEEG